jgi:hypothetical protein
MMTRIMDVSTAGPAVTAHGMSRAMPWELQS